MNNHIHDYIAPGGHRQLQQIKWFLFDLKQPEFAEQNEDAWIMTRTGNIQTALNFIKMSGVRLPLISKAALESGEPTTWDHVYSNTSVARYLIKEADAGNIDEEWIDNNLASLIPTIMVTRWENALLGDWVKRHYKGDFNQIKNMEHYKWVRIELLEMTEKEIGRKKMYAEHITPEMSKLIIA